MLELRWEERAGWSVTEMDGDEMTAVRSVRVRVRRSMNRER